MEKSSFLIESTTGNNNTPSYEVLFGMNGASGKYIRIAIRDGAHADYNGMQARELIVFGK